MMSYAPFWETLKCKNITTYALIEKHNISSSVITRMRKSEYLSLRKINDLCEILNCKVQDIVEYIPDKKE